MNIIHPLPAYVQKQNEGDNGTTPDDRALHDKAKQIVAEIWDGPNETAILNESLADFMAHEYNPDLFLWEDRIVRGGLTVIVGPEKSLKSFLCSNFALSATLGTHFMGKPVLKCRPWLIEGEGTPLGWQRRFAKMLTRRQIRDLRKLPLQWSLRKQFDLADKDSVVEIVFRILKHDIDLVIIGPLSHVASIESENDSAEIKAIGKRLHLLCERLDITIVLAHHTRKFTREPKDIREFFNNSRGSSALMGLVDGALGLQRNPEDNFGYLWSMQREAAVSKPEFFTFDPEGFAMELGEAPDAKDTDARRVEKYLMFNFMQTMKELEAIFGKSDSAIMKWIAPAIAKGTILKRKNPRPGGRGFVYDLSEERYQALCAEEDYEYRPRNEFAVDQATMDAIEREEGAAE